jgi:GT2 family glycosyltransferase/glycosyltransferase involved in cell wall biosynthesis
VSATVSIIIPVFNKVAFTRQCLAHLARHASSTVPHQVIVIDNASSDATDEFLREASSRDPGVVHVRNEANVGFSRANNQGARLATGRYLLFLNNDTIVQRGWLEEMVKAAESDAKVGIVGIKQLFPYTNRIHHTGIIFSADRRPQHIYPHANGSLGYVNKQREYQAVTGSCLLIPRDLFADCGMFDEGYRNGYEDVDLCLTARERGRTVVCCTRSFIYHYGQITETRTADDDANLARFMSKWGDRVKPDELFYFRQDEAEIAAARPAPTPAPASRAGGDDLVYFADDLSSPSALTWVTSELVLAMHALRLPVAIRQGTLPASTDRAKRQVLERLMLASQPRGGIQIRWSHYWPQHLGLELTGRTNLELFVINYFFARPGTQPWDYWLQCLAQNRHGKLPLSTFCRDVLVQTGVRDEDCHILRPGYSPEVHAVDTPARRSGPFRFLTVTNSHDLERYGTLPLLDAYWRAFSRQDHVVMVVKDYGASSGDTTLRRLFKDGGSRAAIEYVTEFTSKEALIALYKSCDAFVSAHRAEGYGMKLLDALACGVPAITPLFGGPTDFCTPDNCFPVDFTTVPVGDCLDTRSLRILNGPEWAEPDLDSLVRQMRHVAANPDEAKRVGARGRQDVIDRFTWTEAARQFGAYLATAARAAPAAVGPAPVRAAAAPTERSPYWMGLRLSVVIPTYNRKAMLLKCLRALAAQTIRPQEFEVVVADDGSTDGTGEMLESERFPFAVKYFRQQNQGPGMARNEGVRRADGELVLFIGDDIIADERLLEEHLIAHAARSDPGAAVLGHIDWVKELPRTAVMDFVCGESSLQFAYAFIPTLARLDYRFFYTSNVSVRRQFLVDAAAAGVAFDPDFRYAAFEDSEFAYRLEKRGLELRYAPKALAYHEHWMDVDNFARREVRAGQMAVVFYRKHPQMDELLQVRWIGDWVDAVETLTSKPELDASLRVLDSDTDALLRSLARTLEDIVRLQAQSASVESMPRLSAESLTRSLNVVLGIIFEVERTRGKVEEWYHGVEDREKVAAARRLIACMRKLEFFAAHPAEIKTLQSTIGWLNHDVVGGLRSRVADLERQLGLPSSRGQGRSLDRAAMRVARRVDLLIQQQLGRSTWLGQYQSVRGRLKRILRPAPGTPPR